MITRLTKHGEGWALLIDKPVLDLLQIDPETSLEITTDGKQLLITPAPDEERSARYAKFKLALEETNRRYAPALQRLAE